MILVSIVANLHCSNIIRVGHWGGHPALVPAPPPVLRWEAYGLTLRGGWTWPQRWIPRTAMTMVYILRMWMLAYNLERRVDKVCVCYVVAVSVELGLSGHKPRFSDQPILVMLY